MTDKSDHSKNPELSEAARTMRTSSNPEERSKAAAKMGHIGGIHSHDNDPNKKTNSTE